MCDSQAAGPRSRSSTIVIDVGTDTSKVGLAGDDWPRAVFPSVVGVPRPQTTGHRTVGWEQRDTYVGDEARPSTDIFNRPLPAVQAGLIANWDSIEKIWHHIFYSELRVAPEEHPVLLTEAPLNPKHSRERMVQMMFEKFRCPAVCVCNSAVLSLYASGRTTGIVLESGQEVTHAVPVYEGHALQHAITRLCYGGRTTTDHLRKAMDGSKDARSRSSASTSTPTYIDRNSMKQIKEKVCLIADNLEDLSQVENESVEVNYELPDGKVVTVGRERFTCPEEVLFRPKMLSFGLEADMGIPEAILNSMDMCNDDVIRSGLWDNIVLSGGNTMFEGLPKRLEKEIRACEQNSQRLGRLHGSSAKVIADDGREFYAWLGGSVLASSQPSFEKMSISKQEYEECGASAIHRRCL